MKKLKEVAKDNEMLQSVVDFIAQFDKVDQYYEDIKNKQGEIDRELSNWYHVVEGIDIKHISESHNLIKMGKDILKRRRENKLEMIILRSTHDMMNTQIRNLKLNLEKTVNKNSEVVEEIKDRAIL
jgi:tetrahydromethanopterin S-methyltransferase subunit F